MEIDHWYLGVKTHEILSNVDSSIVKTNTTLDKVSELVDEFITSEPQKVPYTFHKAIEAACYADTELKTFTLDFASFRKEVRETEHYGQVNEWNVPHYLYSSQQYESRISRIMSEANKALNLIEAVFKYYRGDRIQTIP